MYVVKYYRIFIYKSKFNGKKNPLMHEQISRRLKYRNPFNHQTVLFKKSVLKAGNYKDVPFFEDYYLWVRMKTKSSIFGNLNKILVRQILIKIFMTDDLVLAIYENINFS